MASQLTIPGTVRTGGPNLDEEIVRLERRWAERTTALKAVEAAAHACAARFGSWGDRPLSAKDVARLDAYFSAVVRRRVLSGGDASSRHARSVLVARSIEADLVQGGWAPARAAAEARRAAGLGARALDVA